MSTIETRLADLGVTLPDGKVKHRELGLANFGDVIAQLFETQRDHLVP